MLLRFLMLMKDLCLKNIKLYQLFQIFYCNEKMIRKIYIFAFIYKEGDSFCLFALKFKAFISTKFYKYLILLLFFYFYRMCIFHSF